MTTLQTQTLNSLRIHVPGIDGFNNGEKVVQTMAYLADVVKVREELGVNHGKYVDDFLKEAGGLGPGNPWCAAAINWVCEMWGIPNPDKADAAVIGWKNWAKVSGRLTTAPKRGYLCLYLHANGSGHIGVVLSAGEGMVRSVEGNTSSGQAGSQRDGDGLYRRARLQTTWQYYIDLS